MDISDVEEHDAAHFTKVHARAVEAIIATQRGEGNRASKIFDTADCDECLAEALAGIAARMGDKVDVETAACLSLTWLLDEIG